MAQKRIPKRVLPQSGTTFQAYKGETASGSVYEAPVALERTQVAHKRRVIKGPNDTTHISSTQVYYDASVEPDVPAESLVTVYPGKPQERTAVVLSIEFYHDPKTYSLTVLNLE